MAAKIELHSKRSKSRKREKTGNFAVKSELDFSLNCVIFYLNPCSGGSDRKSGPSKSAT